MNSVDNESKNHLLPEEVRYSMNRIIDLLYGALFGYILFIGAEMVSKFLTLYGKRQDISYFEYNFHIGIFLFDTRMR